MQARAENLIKIDERLYGLILPLGERETCLRFCSAVLGLTHYFRVARKLGA
jgi:hypothetical protein